MANAWPASDVLLGWSEALGRSEPDHGHVDRFGGSTAASRGEGQDGWNGISCRRNVCSDLAPARPSRRIATGGACGKGRGWRGRSGGGEPHLEGAARATALGNYAARYGKSFVLARTSRFERARHHALYRNRHEQQRRVCFLVTQHKLVHSERRDRRRNVYLGKISVHRSVVLRNSKHVFARILHTLRHKC